MSKRSLVYIPILILAAFAGTALVLHYANFERINGRFVRPVKLPFSYLNGKTYNLTAEAEAAGVQAGDRIEAINGRDVGRGDTVFEEELDRMSLGTPVRLSLSRASGGEERTIVDAAVLPAAVIRDTGFYASVVVNVLFVYVLPTFCILLGFWVLFVRPHDPLAWILLFVLLGLSALSLENYWDLTTVLGAFQDITFASWAVAMLLFGIYFPERWALDIRMPWLKWLLIVPLGFQIVLTLFSILLANTGINLFTFLGPLPRLYSSFAFVVNMIAIGAFFAALGRSYRVRRSSRGAGFS